MSDEAIAKVTATNKATPVVVWSKTYCVYCDRVLCLLASIEPRFPVKVLQLDEMPDGSDIQAALLKLTSCLTVPQVFVGEKFIGGCTETTELHENKKLEPAISSAVAAYTAGKDAPVIPSKESEDEPTEVPLQESSVVGGATDDVDGESNASGVVA